MTTPTPAATPSPTATPAPTATPTPTSEPSLEPTEEPTEEPTDEPSEPVETTCTFDPATTELAYRAQLEVPNGFLLVSVKDIHDGEPYEHLDEQSQIFDELVRSGKLTVIVQRVGVGEGELRATFSTLTGRPLGSGTCPLG